jgi:putative Ca2+/H+ antiporter (TMEM165/GDT1 family)
MAAWTLIPDKIEDDEAQFASRLGVFGATFVSFFLAEMGDKTQIATVAMAAQYAQVQAVVAGTTLGMLIANVPVVFVGDRLAQRIPMQWGAPRGGGAVRVAGRGGTDGPGSNPAALKATTSEPVLAGWGA